jgi:hypothetical protein
LASGTASAISASASASADSVKMTMSIGVSGIPCPLRRPPARLRLHPGLGCPAHIIARGGAQPPFADRIKTA